nr:ABC transporter substrate-binding protein [Kibdelosporangium sp. MJ126-NF4]CEL21561.1 ABC Fe(3+) transporter, substrate binding component [Kibdelosporangium sp. MJ126-NF4]CTQ95871.1 ABC Fe(3+) transporter, substrate binding component [Kibdelosporangium sp. MJ126-NF4]
MTTRLAHRVVRRRAMIAGTLAVALAVVAGCGSGTDTAKADGATRKYTNVNGSTDIPVAPKSVVALDQYTYFALLDVGYSPKATASGYTDSFAVFPEYVDHYEKVAKVGLSTDIDLEKVGAQDPDLILGNKFLSLDKHNLEAYNKIAPTVIFGGEPGEPGIAWPVWQIQIADMIGRKPEAEALKKKYDDRAAQIRSTYADKLAKTKFALVQGSGGKWYLNLEGSWGGTILKDLGVQFARGGVTDPNMNTPDFSIEQLDKLDEADVILYQADYKGKAGADTQAIIDLPAYKNLKAVKAGKSLPTGNFYALHYKAAMTFQDEIEKILKDS